MLTYSQAFYDLRNKLQPLYDEREASAIAHELMQHITGLDKTGRLIQKGTLFTPAQQSQYDTATVALQEGQPLQYVTNTAWFIGRQYYVNENVLIPRPETEELVQWIADDLKTQTPRTPFSILDIGTGSGCIPISLKLQIPASVVTGCDISVDALSVAKKNADRLLADVVFIELDFLDRSKWVPLPVYDIIVSNPPYIPLSERTAIHTNVKDFEPPQALFVPDDDALLFYRAIAAFGKEHLKDTGYIYCELDAAHAMACKILFEEMGYKHVEIRKDMHNNWRMLKAAR